MEYDKIFLKKLQDCILSLDELDQIIETNGERQSKNGWTYATERKCQVKKIEGACL